MKKNRRVKSPLDLELSTDLDSYYEHAYSEIAAGGGFGFASRLQHQQLEKYRFPGIAAPGRFLEVGAGQGQHIDFVNPASWCEYIQTDLRPPNKSNSENGVWITDSVDASSLPFEDQSFDRLIATCVLAHTDDPSATVREWKRVVRSGGIISLYLPTESSLALALVRHLGPKQARIRAGFDPSIIYLDHRYNYKYLRTVIDIEFGESQIESRRFPRLIPWWMALWEIIHIKV